MACGQASTCFTCVRKISRRHRFFMLLFTDILRLPVEVTEFEVLVRADRLVILIALADAFRLPVEVIVAFSVRQLSDNDAFDGLFLYRESQRCR